MPQRYQPAQPPQGVLNSTAAAGPSGTAAASTGGAQLQTPSPAQATQGILNATDAGSASWASPASQGGAEGPTQQPDQAALVDPGASVIAPAAVGAQTPPQQQPLTAQGNASSTTAGTAAGPSQSTAASPKQDVSAMSSSQPPAATSAYGNPQPYVKEYEDTGEHWRKLAIAGMHAVCTIGYTCSSDCSTLPAECRKVYSLKRLTVLYIASGGAYAYCGDLRKGFQSLSTGVEEALHALSTLNEMVLLEHKAPSLQGQQAGVADNTCACACSHCPAPAAGWRHPAVHHLPLHGDAPAADARSQALWTPPLQGHEGV